MINIIANEDLDEQQKIHLLGCRLADQKIDWFPMTGPTGLTVIDRKKIAACARIQDFLTDNPDEEFLTGVKNSGAIKIGLYQILKNSKGGWRIRFALIREDDVQHDK